MAETVPVRLAVKVDGGRRRILVVDVEVPPAPTHCEGSEGPCDETEGLERESSRTMYDWDGLGLPPNQPVLLCRRCAKYHHEYWDEMWSMANSDKL
jgi:hypothetical protein